MKAPLALVCGLITLLVVIVLVDSHMTRPTTGGFVRDTLTFQGPPTLPPSPEPVTILAFGDMMLDRAVRRRILVEGNEYPFAPLIAANFFRGYDIVVANAEGPFTSQPSKTIVPGVTDLTFTFDPAMLPTLRAIGFTLLSQSNNHTFDFGLDGYRESIANIEQAGIGWFGSFSNETVAPFVKNVRGQKIAFVGYHQYGAGGSAAVLAKIRELRAADGMNAGAVSAVPATFIIVYPHWGEEYNPETTETQRTLAHAFVDAGADAVLGAHPHVIEPIEVYKNRAIFYSLGNFIFDQDFSVATQRGLAVSITIDSTHVRYETFPLALARGQASLLQNTEQSAQNPENNDVSGRIFTLERK